MKEQVWTCEGAAKSANYKCKISSKVCWGACKKPHNKLKKKKKIKEKKKEHGLLIDYW